MSYVEIHRDGDTSHAYTEGHREDALGALRYIVDAFPGEPLFVIRGRDVLAIPVLQAYINECHEHGNTGQAYHAGDHFARFVNWQRENAKLTHMPDPSPSAGNGAN